MSTSSYVPIPMRGYVLIVGLSMIALIVALTCVAYYFDVELPSSSGTSVTLVTTMIGLIMFARKVDRPMERVERLWFAAGVTLVNAVVPLLFVIFSLWLAGLPLNLQSFDLLYGGGKGYLIEPGLAWLMVFIFALIFAQSYFFGWLITRKLPRKSR